MSSLNPIRICYVIDNLSRAGTEMQLRLLLTHLDRERVTPYLCLLDGESDLSRELEPENVTITRLGIKRLASPRAITQAMRFRKFLKQNKIQIVQSFFPDSTRFAGPLSKLFGISNVLGTRRNIGHWMTPRDQRIAKFYNRFFIDKIIANCESARQAVIEQENAKPPHVLVIPNGIDLTRFECCTPWRHDDHQDHWTIGMVGNLRHVKGPDLFIDAAHLLLQKNKHLRFKIAGGGDPSVYQQQVKALGIQQSLEILGSVSDVPTLLSSLDVAVLPSRAEGMPNAVLEYMAAGRPIVATRVGGTPELIQHDISGILTAAESAAELADGIQRLLDEPDLAENLARAARDNAQERHDIQRISQEHTTVYQNGIL